MIEMDDQDAVVLAAIFKWAWRNRIEVALFQEYMISNPDPQPMLKFSRGDKHIVRAFWQLSDIGPRMEHEWQRIGVDLCVEPFKSPLANEEHKGAE